MPSKHYLPEMSDSPLHWVTRPLRSFMLRHTRRRRPVARWFPTTARHFTGTRLSSSTIRDRPPSSSTPPTHRPIMTSLSKASRRRGKSYSAGNGCCPNRLRIRSGRYPKRISPQRSGTFIGKSVYLRLHPNPPARQCPNKFDIALAYSYLWLTPKILRLGNRK